MGDWWGPFPLLPQERLTHWKLFFMAPVSSVAWWQPRLWSTTEMIQREERLVGFSFLCHVLGAAGLGGLILLRFCSVGLCEMALRLYCSQPEKSRSGHDCLDKFINFAHSLSSFTCKILKAGSHCASLLRPSEGVRQGLFWSHCSLWEDWY